LLKGCQIVGVFWGSFVGRQPERHRANAQQLQQWLDEGLIRPYVSATYPLERGGEAIAALGRRQATGKLVVTMT
jgi:NADPH2:quinone reductase